MMERLRAAWIDHDENRDVLLVQEIRVQQQGRVRRAAMERELNMGREEMAEQIGRFLGQMERARAQVRADDQLLARNQINEVDDSDDSIDGLH